MKKSLMLIAVLGVSALVAAPVVKLDPVAEGFPVWQGVVDKNRISGRTLCPSDLRHKVTVVVEFEPNAALQSQFVLAASLLQATGLVTIEWDWEANPTLPRDVLVVLVNRGGGRDKDREAIQAACKYKGEDTTISAGLTQIRGMGCSMYDDVTFAGAPETAGKRPYVYVMGPTGTTPVFQDALDAKSVSAARKAISAEVAKLKKAENKWEPFYGNIPEPKFNPQLAKALAKGKPLKPVEVAWLKDVVSKDAERATEAQVLYDALQQTRSDIGYRILMEAGACPHRAYYDLQQLIKYWPGEKKKMAAAEAKIKANPEASKLAQMFCKITAWEDANFMCKNAGEAKKIVQDLKKMKKDLEKLKESQVIVIQNGALLMETHVDTLIETMPARVATK